MGTPISSAVVALSLGLWCASAQQNPYASPQDIRAAEPNYQLHCAFCHGRGDDGMAANLKSPRLPHAPSDAAMFQVIQNGITGTDMPPSIGLGEKEIWQLVAYVRSLARLAPEPVQGNPRLGEQLFWGAGNCGTCHMVSGRGGRQGPDLTEAGDKRSAGNLRQSLLDPEASIAGGFLLVNLATRDGRKITGARLNENTFSIQVRDFFDKIHSLRKADLSELKKEAGKSTMPSYRHLAGSDLDNLVAYLVSLRGGP